jgi:hypothetical protein
MVLAPTLLLNAGSGAAIVRPTFSRDFAGEKTLNNGTGPAIAFTRGSHATYFDASGTLRFAPNNAIRNSQAGGAVVGAPGTMPTNWTAGVVPGITAEVVATNSTGGLNYVDVKYSGTNSSGSAVFPGIIFEPATQVVASASQTWTGSFYAAIVAGGATGISSIRADVYENTAAGVFVTNSNTVITLGSTLARYSHTRTLTDATTARVNGRLFLVVDGSATINITLRIAAPQLERGSTATDYNPTTGTAFFGPRFDHDPATGASRGLLIEEARTNSIRNAQAGGASAGVGPTHWTTTATTNNVTRTIVGSGTENGLTYLEIQYAGTPTASGGFTVAFDSTTQVVAADGQTWTTSAFCKLQAGSLAGITAVQVGVDGRSSAGAELSPSQRTMTTFTPTGAALGTQRVSVTRTMAAGAERAFPFILVNYTGGVAMDITLRIAAPQLEQGAFATSYIPTTSAAVTRNADSAIVNPISGFYNASEGTLFAEANPRSLTLQPDVSRVFASLNSGDFNNQINIQQRTSGDPDTVEFAPYIFPSGGPASMAGGGSLLTTTQRVAGAYKSNDFAASFNGGSAVTQSSGSVPSGITHLHIGLRPDAGTGALSGHIRKVAYWPRRLSNALLQSLTT